MFVRAIKSYLTRESTLLSFREGDIIKLTNRDMTLDKGESVEDRAGVIRVLLRMFNVCVR